MSLSRWLLLISLLCCASPAIAQDEICVDEEGNFAPAWQSLKKDPASYRCQRDKDCALVFAGCENISVNARMEPAMRKAAMCVNMSAECMPPIEGIKEIPVCIKNHCEIKIKHNVQTSAPLPDDLFETSTPPTSGTIEELTKP